jgi:dCMP deaminase
MADKTLLDEVFLNIATEVSQLSYCVRKKVGSIIVKDGNILSLGFNGTISGLPNVCEREQPDGSLVTLDSVIHAEQNAILKMAKSTQSCEGATMYLTIPPCVQCAKLIAGSGIRSIVFRDHYYGTQGIDLLLDAGVEVHHRPANKPV